MMLVSALMGLERMQAAYAYAISEGYRFYSYGHFAEDTDIFRADDLLSKTVEQMIVRGALDTLLVIAEVFGALDIKLAEREAAKVKRYASQFPYVNGELPNAAFMPSATSRSSMRSPS
jgi:hypothetical protein